MLQKYDSQISNPTGTSERMKERKTVRNDSGLFHSHIWNSIYVLKSKKKKNLLKWLFTSYLLAMGLLLFQLFGIWFNITISVIVVIYMHAWLRMPLSFGRCFVSCYYFFCFFFVWLSSVSSSLARSHSISFSAYFYARTNYAPKMKNVWNSSVVY